MDIDSLDYLEDDTSEAILSLKRTILSPEKSQKFLSPPPKKNVSSLKTLKSPEAKSKTRFGSDDFQSFSPNTTSQEKSFISQHEPPPITLQISSPAGVVDVTSNKNSNRIRYQRVDRPKLDIQKHFSPNSNDPYQELIEEVDSVDESESSFPPQIITRRKPKTNRRLQPNPTQTSQQYIEEIEDESDSTNISSHNTPNSNSTESFEVIDSNEDSDSSYVPQQQNKPDSMEDIESYEEAENYFTQPNRRVITKQGNEAFEADPISSQINENDEDVVYDPISSQSSQFFSADSFRHPLGGEQIDEENLSQFFKRNIVTFEFVSDETDDLDLWYYGYSRVIKAKVIESQIEALNEEEYYLIAKSSDVLHIRETGDQFILGEPFKLFSFEGNLYILCPNISDKCN
ncbi:hypothetical protein GPJ56_008105 [Histomonas meleagridis]|uniref:uncharacterized protein n=1 Tax=Histomonas meleagridis TaxID=135588 RepID=UPI003559B473|nr:hypothetical protein GPJ56_008105 [Histomonas meleagridis]KAH0798944.1 hypothetical protein GO595_008234 [Histomonas meleagridis]